MAKRRDYYERELVQDLERRFAKNSRARRTRMRLSQDEVAFFMKTIYGFPWHQTMVGKVENGHRGVRMEEAFALCRIYGIELDDMLRGRNLDLIRNGRAVVNMTDATVQVGARSTGDPDAPFVTIESVLQDGQEALERHEHGKHQAQG